MREIKFRAWDKKNSTMFPVSEMRWGGKGNFFRSPGEFLGAGDTIFTTDAWVPYKHWTNEVMQYTGLKDKHGKEIYEGDVIDFENGYIDEIVFDCGAFKLKEGRYLESLSHGIVIGNIYENTELLKQ